MIPRTTLGDLEISRIVYGMWRLGDDSDTSPERVRAKMDACLAQGITTFDQADIYGGYEAEALFGAALKADKSLRDRIEIVTKCDIVAPMGRHSSARVKHYDTSEAHIRTSVDASLRDMGIERIDLLLIHRPDPMMDAYETGGTLDALIAEGKVREVGVSNFRPWDWELLSAATEAPLVTNQIEISLGAVDAFANGDIAFHQRGGVHPMAWSPLGGGALMAGDDRIAAACDRVARRDGVDRAAVAIAFLLAHPSGIVPVMGTNTLARIETFSDAMRVEMDRQTWFELYEAALGREVP